MDVTAESLAAMFGEISPHLDERQRRLLMGAQARALGHGGIRLVAGAAGVREATVSLGAAELEAGAEPLGRARRPGGGARRARDKDPGLVPALLALGEPEERGAPESPLRWTIKSTRKLAAELTRQGHRIGADTVADLLREEGFSLQANVKTAEGRQHPDRDAQFRYIAAQASEHIAAGQPVISVDSKKRENVGPFAQPGRDWRPRGEPVRVRDHDFPDEQLGSVIPYGIYDLAANTGWVNVGTDHNTAGFAAESIRRWWNDAGKAGYPDARRLLITADAGGSKGHRSPTGETPPGAPAVEDRPGRVGRGTRAGDHLLPFPARYLQVEQDRAPAVRLHHHELARPAADQPRRRPELDRPDHHRHRAESHRRPRRGPP